MAYAAPPDSADGAALTAGAGRRRAWLVVAGALMLAGIAAGAWGVSPGSALFFAAAITASAALVAAWRHNLRQERALAEAQRRLADLERSAQTRTDDRAAAAARDIAALEERVAALDQFVYRAAHDLKEPLRGISNHALFLIEDYAETLGEDGQNRLQRLAALSRSASERLSALREDARARNPRSGDPRSGDPRAGDPQAEDPRQERSDDQA